MTERILVAVSGEWQCAKCEGADVPEHHRFCPKRDTRLKIEKVVVVAWPPFGYRGRRARSMAIPADRRLDVAYTVAEPAAPPVRKLSEVAGVVLWYGADCPAFRADTADESADSGA